MAKENARAITAKEAASAITELSETCLLCATQDPANYVARFLMKRAEASSPTGVLAALYISDHGERADLLHYIRDAINCQRELCVAEGFFAPERCHRAVLAKHG